jgi:arylsulfatase
MTQPPKTIFRILLACLLLLLAAVPVLAQKAGKPETFKPQVTGVPGSPGATTTISGKQLPPPDPKFGGVIKEKASESKAWWPHASCRRRARPTCCSS